MVKSMVPPYFQTLVPSSVHQVSQRNFAQLFQPNYTKVKDKCICQSFILLATREWNSLPEHMKLRTSLVSFKYLLNENKA